MIKKDEKQSVDKHEIDIMDGGKSINYCSYLFNQKETNNIGLSLC